MEEIAELLNNTDGSTKCTKETSDIMKSRPGVCSKIAEYLANDDHVQLIIQNGMVWDYYHALCVQGMVPEHISRNN